MRSAITCLVVMVGIVAVLSFASNDATEAIYILLDGGAFVPSRRDSSTLIGFLAASLPTLLHCHLFSGYFSDGLAQEAQYVFSRAGKRGWWAIARSLQLVAVAVVIDFLGCVLATTAACLLIPEAPLGEVFSLCIWAIVLRAPLDAVLILAVNLVALLLNPLLATVAVTGVHFAAILTCVYVPRDVARLLVPLLPSTQGVLAWHDCAALGEYASRGIEGFFVLGSVVYLVCLAAALCVALHALIRRADILG